MMPANFSVSPSVNLSVNLKALLDRKSLRRQPKELRQICQTIFSRGKSLRAQLVFLVGSRLGLKKNEAFLLCRIVEYIHNSSLLHDDLIDQSFFRRRQKAAWREFSPAQAVLAGDYLLSQVNLYLAQVGNLSLLKLTAETLISLAKGEFIQREGIPFRETRLKKTNAVSEAKTGSLFKWCLRAPFIFQGRESPALHALLSRIGFLFGLLFQRSDDLLDFAVRSREKKPLLSDLKQSYFNSFACHLLEDASPAKTAKFKESRSLSSVHKLFPQFQEKLLAFDGKSQKIIDKAEKEIDKLNDFLNNGERGLLENLKPLPSSLYWRR